MSISTDKPIHISLDVTEHWRIKGGIWRYVTSLLKALVQIMPPDSVRAVSFDRLPDDRIESLRATGATLVAEGVQSYIHRPHMAFGRYAKFARNHLNLTPSFPLKGVRAFMAKRAMGKADVYHFPWQPLIQSRSIPCVGTVHDLTPTLFPEFHAGASSSFAEQLNNMRNTCTRIIAVSESTRNDLINTQGFDPEQISVVYQGVETERFVPEPLLDSEILGKHGLTAGKYFLYVGTLEPRKNLDKLVTAYLMARDKYDVDMPLILAGAAAWKTEKLLHRLNTPDVKRSIRHLGHVSDSDLPVLYRGAQGFIYVSLYEGFGIPPLEAMASGTPVIVSKTSSLPEVVGDAGLLVDPENADEIASAISKICSDDKLAKHMKEAGIIRAKQFTWENTARETVSVYREAVDLS